MADETSITPSKNGPYLVRGPVKLVDDDGKEWDVSGKKVIALCRCGRSETKPFCDGTHSKVEFDAPTSAPE